MRNHITENEVTLQQSLGSDGLAQFKEDVDHGEEALRSWQDSEPRIWGKVISRVYRLLDWKSFYKRFTHMLKGADRAAENFLDQGIERWESEGRLSPSEAAQVRSQVSSGDAKNAVHHMGVHLVLSAIPIPIPGLRSLARFLWTVVFWVKAEATRLLRRTSRTAEKVSNIHSPYVMGIALVPAIGTVSYLASPPLRKRSIARVLLDQAAIKMPFKLYTRMRLNRLLARAPR